MSDLIIHIGAAKCGSSSVQAMLRKACRTSTEPTISFIRLKPIELITRLNRSDRNALQTCKSILKELAKADIAVVSHEYLEKNDVAVYNICRIAEQVGYQSILIIGYTRRQDDWRRSNFNQWNFRNTKQLKRAAEVLQKEGWQWQLFSAYERWLITGLISKEGPDWNDQIKQLHLSCDSIQIPCAITSSPLSKSKKPEYLLQHFNQTCKLGLSAAFLKTCGSSKNISFSEYITETIAESILLGEGDQFPIKPHQQNGLLKRISAHLPRRTPQTNPDFTATLEGHYLALFKASNQAYCDQMKINFEEFFSSGDASHTGVHSDFISLIDQENKRRQQHTMEIFESRAIIKAVATRAILQTLCEQSNDAC